MKKIVRLGVVSLLILFLAACGSKEENTEASPAGNSSALTNSNTDKSNLVICQEGNLK